MNRLFLHALMNFLAEGFCELKGLKKWACIVCIADVHYHTICRRASRKSCVKYMCCLSCCNDVGWYKPTQLLHTVNCDLPPKIILCNDLEGHLACWDTISPELTLFGEICSQQLEWSVVMMALNVPILCGSFGRIYSPQSLGTLFFFGAGAWSNRCMCSVSSTFQSLNHVVRSAYHAQMTISKHRSGCFPGLIIHMYADKLNFESETSATRSCILHCVHEFCHAYGVWHMCKYSALTIIFDAYAGMTERGLHHRMPLFRAFRL